MNKTYLSLIMPTFNHQVIFCVWDFMKTQEHITDRNNSDEQKVQSTRDDSSYRKFSTMFNLDKSHLCNCTPLTVYVELYS